MKGGSPGSRLLDWNTAEADSKIKKADLFKKMLLWVCFKKKIFVVVVAGVLASTKTTSNALDASKLQSSVALVAQQHAGGMENQICGEN